MAKRRFKLTKRKAKRKPPVVVPPDMIRLREVSIRIRTAPSFLRALITKELAGRIRAYMHMNKVQSLYLHALPPMKHLLVERAIVTMQGRCCQLYHRKWQHGAGLVMVLDDICASAPLELAPL